MKALFTLQTIVQEGHKRGKRLGFPTINAFVDKTFPEGIYVSFALVGDKRYNALTFIGAAKTYNQTDYLSETYLLDFSQDIYGQTVQVEVLKKLRENQKFETEEALVKQMEEDKRQAIAFFKMQEA
jgi:FAD synthase